MREDGHQISMEKWGGGGVWWVVSLMNNTSEDVHSFFLPG